VYSFDRNRTVYSPKKGPEHWKHDIIDGQTIGRATQEHKRNEINEYKKKRNTQKKRKRQKGERTSVSRPESEKQVPVLCRFPY
jgi:hypothetical protein